MCHSYGHTKLDEESINVRGQIEEIRQGKGARAGSVPFVPVRNGRVAMTGQRGELEGELGLKRGKQNSRSKCGRSLGGGCERKYEVDAGRVRSRVLLVSM